MAEGSIKNVGLLDVNISGEEDVGGLVGDNNGNIKNSHSTGEVSGEDDTGGLVGMNYGGNHQKLFLG